MFISATISERLIGRVDVQSFSAALLVLFTSCALSAVVQIPLLAQTSRRSL